MENIDKLQILEEVLGIGHKTNRDYYQFNCPFCNHHKPKLGVSLGTGKWKCWVCGVNGGKVFILFNKLLVPANTVAKAKKIFVESHPTKKELPVTESSISLPPEFIPLWKKNEGLLYKRAVNYLLSRGVTMLDIFKHRIGYCYKGRYSDMIIFPFYDTDGRLVYFATRSYQSNPKIKFLDPIQGNKDQVFDEGLVNWSEPIILVESKLDSITVRRNAIPLNGKKISKALFKKILDENVKVIYLCLDGDAVKDIMEYSKWFNEHGIEVYATQFPIDEQSSLIEGKTIYHDPTSLGHEKVWEYINTAKKITEFDSFRFKILSKLR